MRTFDDVNYTTVLINWRWLEPESLCDCKTQTHQQQKYYGTQKRLPNSNENVCRQRLIDKTYWYDDQHFDPNSTSDCYLHIHELFNIGICIPLETWTLRYMSIYWLTDRVTHSLTHLLTGFYLDQKPDFKPGFEHWGLCNQKSCHMYIYILINISIIILLCIWVRSSKQNGHHYANE